MCIRDRYQRRVHGVHIRIDTDVHCGDFYTRQRKRPPPETGAAFIIILPQAGSTKQLVDLLHDLEGVAHVKHVALALGPAAARVGVDGAAFADEAPAHHVGLLAVAAGGQSFRMARGRAGLPHLVHVRQKRDDRPALAGDVHQRLGGTQGSLGAPEETLNQGLGNVHVHAAVGLLLGPARTGNQQHVRVGPDGLLVLGHAFHARMFGAHAGKVHGHRFQVRAASTFKGVRAAGIQSHDPGTLLAGQRALHALAIKPAAGHRLAVHGLEPGQVGVHPPVQPDGQPRQGAAQARGGRSHHDLGRDRPGKGLCGSQIGPVDAVGKRCVGDRVKFRAAPSHGIRSRGHVRADQPHGQIRTQPLGQGLGSAQTFQGYLGKGAVTFGMCNVKYSHASPQLFSHSTISRAISSSGASLTIRVSRRVCGSVTDSNFRLVPDRSAGLACIRAGMFFCMFCMPICGLLGGSGSSPVAHPMTAGALSTTDFWYAPPSTRSRTSMDPSPPTVTLSTP
eukprot:TRINITY_DN29250_c0_g1_i1.p1 TRINITY_DN29250_c0_g1~~TRINITY_DN29250_c0_g1_i1.p1  ORF type:complete len:505 (+),score=162.05 TRINITY_DN29250_c0_g1_i1:111-1625(+)